MGGPGQKASPRLIPYRREAIDYSASRHPYLLRRFPGSAASRVRAGTVIIDWICTTIGHDAVDPRAKQNSFCRFSVTASTRDFRSRGQQDHRVTVPNQERRREIAGRRQARPPMSHYLMSRFRDVAHRKDSARHAAAFVRDADDRRSTVVFLTPNAARTSGRYRRPGVRSGPQAYIEHAGASARPDRWKDAMCLGPCASRRPTRSAQGRGSLRGRRERPPRTGIPKYR